MKKKFIASLALGMSLFANLAFAELDGTYVNNILNDNHHWPLITVCTGSDVNVRTQPNTNCDVITMLNQGDKFYVTDVVFKNDYTWLRGYIHVGFDKFTEGYMVSKYLEQAPRAATPSERFRAAFETAKNYDMYNLARECGIPFQYDPSLVENVKEELFPYSPHRIKVGPYWVHGEKFDDGFHPIGFVFTTPGYTIAGLEVGKHITETEMQEFDKNMNFISWAGHHYDEDKTKHYIWYLDDTVDGQPRPVEAFRVFVKNNVITEMRFHHIPID